VESPTTAQVAGVVSNRRMTAGSLVWAVTMLFML
jgi:hypothetical protein